MSALGAKPWLPDKPHSKWGAPTNIIMCAAQPRLAQSAGPQQHDAADRARHSSDGWVEYVSQRGQVPSDYRTDLERKCTEIV